MSDTVDRAVGASVVRLIIYVQILGALTSLDPTLDADQALAVSLWWSLLEVGLALIAACLPTLSYLFARFNLQDAIASVRSVFSLQSWSRSTVHVSSRRIKPSQGTASIAAPHMKMGGKESSSSQTNIFVGDKSSEEHAMTEFYNPSRISHAKVHALDV